MADKNLVMIVDDTPENLHVLGDMLELQGYDILVAINGLEALANAKGTPSPDLILLDIMMSDMDGYEVCRRLKADPELCKIPVIFISALGMTEQKVQAFQFGAVDYITKPFQVQEVLARVHTHIQLARMETLKEEIQKRKNAEAELSLLNKTLEDKVLERTAQLTEVNEFLDSFCASVSHDLRTPLSNIFGLCTLLHDEYSSKFEKEGIKLIDYLLSETKRIMFRIEALLDYSRLNREKLELESVDLSALTKRILANFQLHEPSRPVTLSIEENIVVKADPNLICEVMENLLSNAWKYTSKTTDPHIELGTEFQDGTLVVFVRDNGVGFDMNNSQNLFKMFHRLHSDSEFEGDGIGLATVQKIIHRHGGKIWADAKPGNGAIFRFTI